MSFSSIVLNASPLICLSKSGLSEVLPALFEQIVVPPSVINEVLAGNNPDAGIRVLLRQQWLHPTG